MPSSARPRGDGIPVRFPSSGFLEEKYFSERIDLDGIADAAGQLDNMPDSFKYAIIRGFQLQDFMHVVTGYDSSRTGELALQAFCLAQIRFPYFAMWMSVGCSRMTFVPTRSSR